VRYRILGEPAALSHAGPVAIPGQRQSSLLAVFLAHRNATLSESRLMDWLWGDEETVSAKALQIAVSRLRRALGPDGGQIETLSGGYRLRVEAGSVDADRFIEGLAQGRRSLQHGDAAGAVTRLEAALGEWEGPAYGSQAEARWAVREAVALEELRLQARQMRSEALLSTNSPGAAVDELADLVHEHPEREAAVALLMTALYRAGRQREALITYKAVRRQLADEMGLDPSPQLERLERAVLQQAPELVPHRAPQTPANLPNESTRFIGRTQEIAALQGVLIDHRLVTLIGPGGSGKTRLAVEYGRNATLNFPGGVTFVDLLPVNSPELVLPAIATVLGERLEPNRGVAQIIGERIGRERTLLILDNLEQVIGVGPDLSDLVRRAPGLHLLGTSRIPLRVRGETSLAVEPLLTPPEGPELTLEGILASDSVALFADRAASARPGWQVGPDEAGAVAELCRRLDGIPLGIELAAAAIRDRSVEEVLGQTDPLLPSLDGGLRDLPARQQSMHALIGWSHGLLPEASRRVFDRLGVFSGGWTAEAAAVVCDEVLRDASAAGAEAVLDDLVIRSLVLKRSVPSGPRFSMLETIQGFARERLQEGEEEPHVRRKHAAYMLHLARAFYDLYDEKEPMPPPDESDLAEAHPGPERSWSPAPPEAVESRPLTAEGANLRSALDWALTSDSSLAAPLALASSYYWFMTGQWVEGYRYLRAAVDITTGPPLVRAHLLLRAGALAIHGDHFDQSLPLLGESLKLVRNFGTKEQVARVLMPIAGAHTSAGEYARAATLLRQAARMSIEAGNEPQTGHLYNYLCQNLALAGDHSHAIEAGLSAIAWFTAAGAEAGLATAYGYLAAAELAAGLLAKARAHLDRSLSATMVLRWERYHTWNLMLHGVLQISEGDSAAAANTLREDLRLCARSTDRWTGTMALEALGRAQAALGAMEEAAAIFGAAEELREEIRSPLPPLFREAVEAAKAAVQASLPPDDFARHRAAFRNVSFSHLVQLIAPQNEVSAT
jgi:predicted ATPase/DNA-binding SARP family transcriptional activator/tetratricopeptide (TPR) repeat protein